MRFESVELDTIEAARRGDPAAFERLCSAIQSDLYSYLYAFLRNHEDTVDALQETLIRMHRFLPTLKEARSFPGWVLRIAANYSRTELSRRSGRAMQSLDDGPPDGSTLIEGVRSSNPSPRDTASAGEIQKDIAAAIERLPAQQRAAIVLFEVEGRTLREIAGALECSEGAVKFHLHEARQKLRNALQHHMSTEPATSARTGEVK